MRDVDADGRVRPGHRPAAATTGGNRLATAVPFPRLGGRRQQRSAADLAAGFAPSPGAAAAAAPGEAEAGVFGPAGPGAGGADGVAFPEETGVFGTASPGASGADCVAFPGTLPRLAAATRDGGTLDRRSRDGADLPPGPRS